jgi:soluble cytochrome b562
VHEESKKVNTILHSLSMLEEKYKAEEDNGDALEKYQEGFEELLKTLEGEKVVIVAGCGC